MEEIKKDDGETLTRFGQLVDRCGMCMRYKFVKAALAQDGKVPLLYCADCAEELWELMSIGAQAVSYGSWVARRVARETRTKRLSESLALQIMKRFERDILPMIDTHLNHEMIRLTSRETEQDSKAAEGEECGSE